jgi:hypothetical protein
VQRFPHRSNIVRQETPRTQDRSDQLRSQCFVERASLQVRKEECIILQASQAANIMPRRKPTKMPASGDVPSQICIACST